MEMEGDSGGQPAKKISLTEVVSDSRDKKCDGDGFRVPTTYMKEEL
jgi:hypothetical protein